MLRLHIDRKHITVACHGMNEPFVDTARAHYLLLLNAVQIGIFFKIEIVQKSRPPPEILFVRAAELPRKIPHNSFDRHGVFQMKVLFVEFRKQFPRFFSCNHVITSFLSGGLPALR